MLIDIPIFSTSTKVFIWMSAKKGRGSDNLSTQIRSYAEGREGKLEWSSPPPTSQRKKNEHKYYWNVKWNNYNIRRILRLWKVLIETVYNVHKDLSTSKASRSCDGTCHVIIQGPPMGLFNPNLGNIVCTNSIECYVETLYEPPCWNILHNQYFLYTEKKL